MSQTLRRVLIDDLPVQRHGERLVTIDATLSSLGDDLNPFLAVSLYDMRGPTFPPHPHAGFMVATYILPESETGFVNQDSLGHRNPIPPGALHVTVAGRGVLHEEQPIVPGPLARGFQIWIDLPDQDRECDPFAVSLPAENVPQSTRDGARLRVLLGRVAGLESPLRLPTPVTLADIDLRAGSGLAIDLPAEEHAFLFVVAGRLTINGDEARVGQLVRTCAGRQGLALAGDAAGARLALFAGMPLSQPRVQQGPFVARDPAQLRRFVTAFERGDFGRLQPFSSQVRPVPGP